MIINFNYFSFLLFFVLKRINPKLLYPPSENIAINKPLTISPAGTTCGLEVKDTLCDNRILDNKKCSEQGSLFYCDESCPYGNVLTNLNRIEQIKLETMNPCLILKDYGTMLSINEIDEYSYYFDRTNNLCNNEIDTFIWRPFELIGSLSNPSLTFYNSRTPNLEIINSGFTVSMWIKQFRNNNGTIINLINDVNESILEVNIQSSTKKIYINYICDVKYLNKSRSVATQSFCFLEINPTNLFNNSDQSNYLCLKIYKNILNIFINEPSSIDENPKLKNIDLKFDLGSYIINKSKDLNYFIGTSQNGRNSFYGWIQNVRVFLISLVNIEIYNLFKKTNKSVSIQPECRCPNEYPKNVGENSIDCISNKNETPTILNSISRLNNYAHPINFLNDDDFKTSWISCILTITNPITIDLDLLNGIYIIQRIEIYFSSLPPTTLNIERYINGKWMLMQLYSIDCENARTLSCIKLPDQFADEKINGFSIIWSTGIENEAVFFTNHTLVERSKASKIRFTLKGYYTSFKRDIRQLYYAISEIRIRGSCDCNGYSSNCNTKEIPFSCDCENTSFTDGFMCNSCKSLYNNYKYQTRYSNSSAVCNSCNCNNLADSCVYDIELNQGICKNCKNNTDGNNCESCSKSSYFSHKTGSCTECNCSLVGVNNNDISCDLKTAQCYCKPNANGLKCNNCKPGFFNLTKENPLGCSKCDCNRLATYNISSELSECDEKTGQCKCLSLFVQGLKCDSCTESTYDLASGCTKRCNCDPVGSLSPICDEKTGKCDCKPKIGGIKCDICENGFYNFTRFGCMSKCICDPIGSLNLANCDSVSGNCKCKQGYIGKNCSSCASGYWRSNNECIKCTCNLNGIMDEDNICDQRTGRCICNNYTEGFSCNKCKPGYWGFNNITNNVCKKCECDPIGTNPNTLKEDNYICDPITSQCECNPNRIGTRCETCAVGFFFLNINGIDCLECNCDPIGSIPESNCNSLTGECSCVFSNGIGGTICDQCLPGYFNFSRATGSCSLCNCNTAGSIDQDCDFNTGQCNCKEFVTGVKCNRCIPGTSNLEEKNPFGCSKSPSKQSPPRFEIINSNLIRIKWDAPDYPNGIIRYYSIFRNDTFIGNSTHNFIDDNSVYPFINYAYKVQVFNDEGNTTSRVSYITITLPTYPCCDFYFRVFNVKSYQIDLIWTFPEKENGMNLTYFIQVFKRIDYIRPVSQSNLVEKIDSRAELNHNELMGTIAKTNSYFQYKLSNLMSYTQYFINIKACNRDLIETSKLYCINGYPFKNISSYNFETLNNSIGFITSQDRPQLQPAPILLSTNSTFIVAGILRPERPNGVILLYEVWIRQFDSSESTKANNSFQSLNSQNLACVIEELYDPNDVYSLITDNKPKICIIKNLNVNTRYLLSATSSTLIGRSLPSIEVLFNTSESSPICPPKIDLAFSYKTDSIFFKWYPSINMSLYDVFWRRCIGGSLKNFTIYLVDLDENNASSYHIIYQGPENSFNKTDLIFSTEYQFRIELCNRVGCASTEIIKVTTLDPLPNPWGKVRPSFEIINGSYIRFDWNLYQPFNTRNDNERLNYRLERSEISFSYPPSPLESGIRFHGYNFFKFNSEDYFPQGYPHFGIKYAFQTKIDSFLGYFAASNFDQTELIAIQMLKGEPWFISETESGEADSCSLFLNPNISKAKKSLNDNKWHSLEAYRIKNFGTFKLDNNNISKQLSSCNAQVVTDVTGVYIGGVPYNFITRDETEYSSTPFKIIERKNFIGCMKNISTILQIEEIMQNNSTSLKIGKIDLDFNKAEPAPGEPLSSNAFIGCPINLETDQKPINLLGYGFIFVDLKQTFPLVFQSNKYFIINLDFRTEWGDGIIFINYDYENDQYIMIRLFDSSSIEILFHCRVKYEDPNSNDKRFSNYFSFNYNQSFDLPQINNGFWSNLNINFDFVNRTLMINLNQTRLEFTQLFTPSSVESDIIEKTQNFTFFFNYYLGVRFYFGGFENAKIKETIDAVNDPYVSETTRNSFLVFLKYLQFLDYKRFFSGCIKNVKINGFLIDFFNTNDKISYQNVRFDGCPNLGYNSLKYNADFMNEIINVSAPNATKLKTVYDGELKFGYDNSFNSYTEYFYRVIAYNKQGESASDWILVRTPDSAPNEQVKTSFLKVKPISGYKIRIDNMSNYCYYCEASNQMNKRFTGIIKSFILTVKEFNKDINDFIIQRNISFYCDTVCNIDINNDNSLLKENFDSNAFSFYIDTKPITNYTLIVSICNIISCAESEPFLVVSLAEAPDGVIAPKLKKKNSSSLTLFWQSPVFPSGNITGYILRLINNDSEKVVYFGLSKEYEISDLKSFTNYTFCLEVCNIFGCTRSEYVTFETSESVPLSVAPPILISITETMIILKWNKPSNDQLNNAVLTGYILYLSQNQSIVKTTYMFNITTCAECSSNIKDLNNLTPGTDYDIILSACTNGGCTNSSTFRISTLESLPDASDISIYAIKKTSRYISLEWTKPKNPNGKINKYILFKNELKIYEGSSNNFILSDLSPNSLFYFSVVFCNNFGCSNKSNYSMLVTDEEPPEGSIILDAHATGSNQIELKWYSSKDDLLKPNGNLLFSVYVEGPYLIEYTFEEAIKFKKASKTFTKILNLNLLNTTIYNTKYGIVDKILPFSNYKVLVNASNTKGFIISNKVVVETLKSGPSLPIPPQLISIESRNIKIEWYDPILINSEDKMIFYQVNYRIKYLWNNNGIIKRPNWELNYTNIFLMRTLATFYTLNNLIPYTAYSFQLIVTNKYGQSISDWSNDYVTKEEIPRNQEDPEVLNISSNSVYIKWNNPKQVNGLIILYRIFPLEYLEDEKRFYTQKYSTTDGSTNQYLVTGLNSYTSYFFKIEACNSIGCTSNNFLVNNKTSGESKLIKTLPSPPSEFDDPVLESINSYSIEIKWKPPAKINGKILFYLLERKDFSQPFSTIIKNPNDKNSTKIITYRFEAEKFKFQDYQNLESCGLYSYRMTVFNQVGNMTTNWINTTVSPSKPIIVTSPIVNLIDSTTARFEWIKPLTYCVIKSYTLVFKPFQGQEFRINADFISFSRQSLTVKNLIPFTKYSVSLISCVDYDKDPCTQSLARTFQTPGFLPQGITPPVVRLISSNAISVEWLEPLFRNGENIEYQLLRTSKCTEILITCNSVFNKTETIYFGRKNFFLDLDIQNNSIYIYKIIYSNEFGYSISDQSNEINTQTFNTINKNDSINEENLKTKTFKLNYDFKSECLSPTSAFLYWKTFSLSEIMNFIGKLFDFKNDFNNQQTVEKEILFQDNLMIQFKNISVINVTIQIKNDKSDIIDYLLSDKNDSDKLNQKVITNLKPSLNYEFNIKTFYQIETINQTIYGKTLIKYETYTFISEYSICETKSVSEAIGQDSVIIKKTNSNFLNVTYSLDKILFQNYQNYQINLSKYLNNKNNSEVIDIKKFTSTDGFKVIGPIEENRVYSIILIACSLSNIMLPFARYPDLFLENNCIESAPILYALTTRPPENITDIHLDYINSTSIKIDYFLPSNPNDFLLRYITFRRKACKQNSNEQEFGCSIIKSTTYSVIDYYSDITVSEERTICCNGIIYEKKYGYECCDKNYIPRPFNYATVCCGGKFYKKLENYQCCANLFYVNVPYGSICCSSLMSEYNELRINIGIGNACCADIPYIFSSKSIQFCCNLKMEQKYLITSKIRFNPYLRDSFYLYESNNCFIPITDSAISNFAKCDSFDLIMNITDLSYVDSDLMPFTTYDYKACIENSFGLKCNEKIFSIQTNISIPKNFSYFNYEIIHDNFIYLTWKYPLYLNGPILHFRLIRNGFEIYKGLNTFYEDMTRHIQPFVAYKYELEVCNRAGCTLNDKILLASTKEKLPELFDSLTFEVSNSSINLNWKQPSRPNGIIEKFVVIIKEIDLELFIYYDFNQKDSLNIISAKNSSIIENLYYPGDSMFDRYIIYSLVIKDLIPNTKYSFKLLACNRAGCTQVLNKNNDKNKKNYITLVTDDYFLFGFQNPVVYVIDDTSAEIVWQKSKQQNDFLTSYKLYRNDIFLVEFNLFSNETKINYKMGFYTYIDSDLIPNSYYSYRIEAKSRYYTTTTENVIIQTSPSKFEYSCLTNISVNINNNPNTVHSDIIPILNLMLINFTTSSSTNISISYSYTEWKNFISCLSKINYNNINNNKMKHLDNFTQIQLDNSIFSMKILLQSSTDGLQSIDFPYPNRIPIDTSTSQDLIRFMITGLIPFNNYSIRISFTTLFPNRQILTTKGIYLQTFDKSPCCELKPPNIIKQYFLNSLSVRFSLPEQPNGEITLFRIIRAKLKGNGCIKLDKVNNTNVEKYSEFEFNTLINSFNDAFFYDQTNDIFIYKDTDPLLFRTFSYYSYKIIIANLKGTLESDWSIPILSFVFLPPSPPIDVKITDAHSTGFTIKFKEPLIFNGIISHYTILINPISSNSAKIQQFLMRAEKICKFDLENDSPNFIEVPITGLQSFKSYRIRVVATSQYGFNSIESEQIIANTLESSPYNLSPIEIIAIESQNNNDFIQNLLFKFFDPEQMNGQLTSINLYLIYEKYLIDDVIIGKVFFDYQLKLIYSGTKRDFLYKNLKPFKNYTFLYEICTYVSCTRSTKPQTSLTLESPPTDQNEPIIERILSNLNCYQIYWTNPKNPNGEIKYFELYRHKSFFNDSAISSEYLVKNFSNLSFFKVGSENYSYIDCNLEPNTRYSYRVISYNFKGNASSTYSLPAIISQPLPEGLNRVKLKQLNTTLIKIDWSKPTKPNGKNIYYYIFRNEFLILNTSGIDRYNAETNISYFDLFDVIPNSLYTYKIEACNEAGCSSNESTSIVSIYTRNQPPLFVDRPILLELEKSRAVLDLSQSVTLKSTKTQTIIEYRIYLNEKVGLYKLVSKGNNTIIALKNLTPFTTYSIKLEACTFVNPFGGCLLSDSMLVFQTNQSMPELLEFDKLTDVPFNEFYLAVKIKWKSPLLPNGILRSVELYRDGHKVFSTRNLSIFVYDDNGLKYGKTYLYEVIYYNDIGSVSSKINHTTQDNLPSLIDKFECTNTTSTKITLEWDAPEFPNGKILNYIIKYKKENNIKWTEMIQTDSNKTWFNVRNLEPNSKYEFQISACNNKGCANTDFSATKKCLTLHDTFFKFQAPQCTEISEIFSNKIILKIEWETPLGTYDKGNIIYTLYKVNVKLSISFDRDYNYPDGIINKKELYTGNENVFIDSSVGFFNTYDYFVGTNTTNGVILSKYSRYTTRATNPLFLMDIGECLALTYQSATFNLKPPLYLNGILINIYIILINQKISKEITLYSFDLESKKSSDLTASMLLKLLSNITLNDLLAETNYEIKTKFCNHVGCLTSYESLKFQTLYNDKIEFFNIEALNSRNLELKWKVKYGNPFKKTIKYEIRNYDTDELIYDGFNHKFLYRVKPYKNYTFELKVVKEYNNSLVVDKQAASIFTPSEKPNFNQYPLVSNSVLTNKSVVLDIDWFKTFILNGPLSKFQLILNKNKIYEGNETSITTIVNITDCPRSKVIKKEETSNLEENYFPVVIKIKVFTDLYSEISPEIEIPLNCTVEYPNISFYKNTSNLESWIAAIIFFIGLVILIARNKKKPTSNILEDMNKNPNTNIKELIDLQDAFSDHSKISLNTIKLDIEKKGYFKKMIELKKSSMAKNNDDSLKTKVLNKNQYKSNQNESCLEENKLISKPKNNLATSYI